LVSQHVVADDPPIAHGDNSVGVMGNGEIMCDEDNGSPASMHELEQAEDFLACLGVECAGGLVGEQYERITDQSACNCDPLLLSS
jgi:hypothetical protein